MFKFLKEKLKGAIEKISKKVEEEAPTKEVELEKPISQEAFETEEETEEKPRKKERKPKKEKKKEEIIAEEPAKEEPKLETEEVRAGGEKPLSEKEERHGFFDFLKKKKETVEEKQRLEEINLEKPEEKKGFFQTIKEKVTTRIINEGQFEDLFWDLEITLLENNVAVEVIEKIKSDLKNDLTTRPIKRDKVEDEIKNSLKSSIENLFNLDPIDITKKIKEKQEKPYVIVFFGVNGSGKTTTIAKFAYLLKQKGISSVISASDTFRAAAIQQLEEHAVKIGIRIIKHDYGSDPAAVAFDAIKHAQSKSIDAVLIDTAGRLHSNVNLIDEMKKIVRVAKPDLKIFVGESITGNDAVEQAKKFNEAIGIDGIILTKSDVDEKGGAIISVSYVTHKPIIYLGNGQSYDRLEKFDKYKIINNLGL